MEAIKNNFITLLNGMKINERRKFEISYSNRSEFEDWFKQLKIPPVALSVWIKENSQPDCIVEYVVVKKNSHFD
jgi:hypothetical protein